MRSVHFMLVITLDSVQIKKKTKLKVTPHWIKVDILKQFAEDCSYLFFRTTDVSSKRISDEDDCLRMSLPSKRIIFYSPNRQQKASAP